MASQFDGKVAFITGAARGQGRSHAVRFAEEGADIIALDLCGQIDSVAYPMATPEDLDETVKLVEKTGRRIVAEQADVRDLDRLEAVVAKGVDRVRPDRLCACQRGDSARRRGSRQRDRGVRRRGQRDGQRCVLHHRRGAARDARARRRRRHRHHQLGGGVQTRHCRLRHRQPRRSGIHRRQTRLSSD